MQIKRNCCFSAACVQILFGQSSRILVLWSKFAMIHSEKYLLRKNAIYTEMKILQSVHLSKFSMRKKVAHDSDRNMAN